MRLMTLSKIAHSTKNATTPTIHIINNSVTILLKFWAQRYKKCGAYINNRCEKSPLFSGVGLLVSEKNLYLHHKSNQKDMNYDSNPVHLLYNNEELRERIIMVMDSRDHTTGITFVNLCYQIVQMAFQEHQVKKADENVTITSEELAPEEQVRVSRILWELIWDHKIFLLFGRSELLGLSNGEDRFVKY